MSGRDYILAAMSGLALCLLAIMFVAAPTYYFREINKDIKNDDIFHVTCPSLNVDYVGNIRMNTADSIVIFNTMATKHKTQIRLPRLACTVEGPL